MPDTIPKLRTPEYPETHKRGKLDKREQAALVLRQEGRCAGCQIKPRFGWEYDHIVELREGGTNDLTNWQAFGSRRDCKCHAKKTAETAGRHAKTRRLRGETGQLKRRRENGPQIKSRGFQQRPDGATSWPKRRMGQ